VPRVKKSFNALIILPSPTINFHQIHQHTNIIQRGLSLQEIKNGENVYTIATAAAAVGIVVQCV
jgi:hypothetical protein